jgi:hypothetical protein
MFTISCSKKPSEKKPDIEYPEKSANVEVAVELCSSECLTDPSVLAIKLNINNQSDMAVNKLEGNIVFFDSQKKEIGKVAKILIYKHPDRSKIIRDSQGTKFVSLPAGQIYEVGLPFLSLFSGYPDLREKAEREWGNWTADFNVVSLRME